MSYSVTFNKKPVSLFGLIAATLVACLVLFGGGVSAAGSLINGRDIESNSIKSRHINDGAVRTDDIRDGTIKKVDLDGALKDELAAKDEKIAELEQRVHDLERGVRYLMQTVHNP